MTNNLSIAGFAAAVAVSIALAVTAAMPANRETKPVQIAQSGQQAESSRVSCYNGLKADRADNWAPLYRGWVCSLTI